MNLNEQFEHKPFDELEWKLRQDEEDGRSYYQALLSDPKGLPVRINLDEPEYGMKMDRIEAEASQEGVRVHVHGTVIYLRHYLPTCIKKG